MTSLPESTNLLLESTSYTEVVAGFEWPQLWDLFDGDRGNLNIAVECLDRHRDHGVGVRLASSGLPPSELSFDELAAWSSRFAHFLSDRRVGPADPVAVMIEPSLPFYAALFGAIKRGAVAVPLFTLFGPEAIRARVQDCGARVVVVTPHHADAARAAGAADIVIFDDALQSRLESYPDTYETTTSADDLAVLQYTSGTSRKLPDAVRHTHRAIVTLMLAARFGLGLNRGDRYFCPSSPAWGHGLWHGTIAPWALGIAAGAYAGRFDAKELASALRTFEITNLAAAGTVYRMLRRDDLLDKLPPLAKASYTGEALDPVSLQALATSLGTPVCGMYGTTETGVILANFPGFEDYEVRPGALGRPLPGWDVTVVGEHDVVLPVDEIGEIAVRRRGGWMRSKDLGRVDADGYFWYFGRADDIVISAGWTISPIEVEAALVNHEDVIEVAIIGVDDAIRGQVLKAFVVSERRDDALVGELQDLVRDSLSPHEYPRHVEFVDELPKTTNGKINRKALRAQNVNL
jgi:acetyl-CoA synthetase